jgi:hypothetical protein
MAICGNGHLLASESDTFCGICGAPQAAAPMPTVSPNEQRAVPSEPATTNSRGRIGLFVVIAAVVIVVLGGAAFLVARGSSSKSEAAQINLVGFSTKDSKVDLYLLKDGEQPLPNTRLATDVWQESIVPLEGPYEEGIHGPIATGPSIATFGGKTAVAWTRTNGDSQTGTVVLVSKKGEVQTVLEETAMISQDGPIAVFYSKKADALLVQIYGEAERCYRIDPDGTATLIVRASRCEFLKSGLVFAVEYGVNNRYDRPETNTFVVTLMDVYGNERSKASISGASYVSLNQTGERIIATSPKSIAIYETSTGGLIAQDSSPNAVTVLSKSSDSNVIAYDVDNGAERLQLVVVRADGSKIDAGLFPRANVSLSDDGLIALVSSSPLPDGGVNSSSKTRVTVQRLNVATGEFGAIAEGMDLHASIVGPAKDQRIVVWSSIDRTVLTGAANGELKNYAIAATEVRSVDLMTGTNDLLLATGPEKSQSLELLKQDGTETVLTRQWDRITPLTASPDGKVLLLLGSSDDRTTLLMWKDGRILEVDRAPYIRNAAIEGDSAVYTVQTDAKEYSQVEVRRRSFDGKTAAETLWSRASLLSSPTRSDPFLSTTPLGSDLRVAYVDETANKCKSRGESVLRPGGSSVGTIGSTKVCIIVPDSLVPVTVTVSSSTDTTMSIYNSFGTRSAYDDDSGISNNPLYRGSLPKGTYTVEVNSYSNRSGGSYLLTYY